MPDDKKELIQHLFEASTANKKFQERFQSFLDQIPKPSGASAAPEKEGFFINFFLGMFASLKSTELTAKLELQNLHFREVQVIRKDLHVIAEFGEDKKKHLFVFSESKGKKSSANLEEEIKNIGDNIGKNVGTKVLIGREILLDKERYVKNIVATVKDISNKGSYRQFLLSVEKLPSVIPVPRRLDPEKNTQILASHAGHIALDNIRISVRTEVEKGIRIGDQVKLSAKLFPPKFAPSDYAYDFARIAYYQKISATGFATSKVALHKKAKARKFQEYIESFRQYIYENLQQNIKKPHADIISALLIGKKDGIDQKTMDAIRDSGIAHLFAISGLHLSFVAGLFFIVFRNLFAISETLTLKYNTKKISAFFTILPTTFYLLVTGMQISAQRAYIMVILVLVAIIIERKYRGLIAIAFAASMILIVEPEAILKPGFQMSFSAVLALVASYQINANKLFKIKIVKYFVSIMISSVIASLATIPYTIYNFNYLSIGGIITNLIAVPIVTLIIIPLGIIYVLLIPLGIEWIIALLIERPIGSVLYITSAIASLQYLVIPIRTFPASSVIITTLGLLCLCLWERNWRFFGIFFIVLGIFFSAMYRTPDILVSADNAAVKESDNLLYSLTRKNRNFVVRTWAKQNGQNQISNHTKFNNSNKRLKCGDYGCIYNKGNNRSVLLPIKKKML